MKSDRRPSPRPTVLEPEERTTSVPTAVHELMSSPPVTCAAESSLADATALMNRRRIGSVVVTERGAILGILTERDLLRANAERADATTEPVRRWMTSEPDVLGRDEEVGAAWSGLTHHHYRHLPVVDGDELVGMVSIRDLLSVAQIRPAGEIGTETPRGPRGRCRGPDDRWRRPRPGGLLPLPPVLGHGSGCPARPSRTCGTCCSTASLPDGRRAAAFSAGSGRTTPAARWASVGLLPSLAAHGSALDALRTGGLALGCRARVATEPRHRPRRVAGSGPAVVRGGPDRRSPPSTACEPASSPSRRGPTSRSRPTTCGCCSGHEAPPEHVRAIEQYLILTIDHGFNASTFTARVVTSTGADLAAAIVGAVAALSGPLHGGAPSRALDMLDAIGTPDRAEAWVRDAVVSGDRIMGFGHRVYKTDDPRSVFLREVARSLGGPLVDFAEQVERTTVAVLAELKPGRRLYTNVEFFAGVVMHTCGIPREMFTPDVRLQPHRRMVHACDGAGRRQPAHSPGGPLRRPDATPTRPRVLTVRVP